MWMLFTRVTDSCRKMQILPSNVSPATSPLLVLSQKLFARWDTKREQGRRYRKAGVPIIPGSDGPVADEKIATKTAQKIGFPVIIKAVAGGGGRGMRIAHNAVTFAKEFQSARMEAEKAFGDGSLYIEKYLENPRHIEFQILADSHGHIIHLGERDCSVQRRHQKVIEESPPLS